MLTSNERTDKIVVYFWGRSFGEIPIVLQLCGSFGLFFPRRIKNLFAHKDYKRALFATKNILVDENKVGMRDDTPPPCPVIKSIKHY